MTEEFHTAMAKHDYAEVIELSELINSKSFQRCAVVQMIAYHFFIKSITINFFCQQIDCIS